MESSQDAIASPPVAQEEYTAEAEEPPAEGELEEADMDLISDE